MTNDERDETTDQMKRDIAEIKLALLGPMSGSASDSRGIIHNVLTLMDDVYNSSTGLKPRMQRYDDFRLKLAGGVAVVSAIAGVIGAAALWVIDKIFLKKP